MYGQQYGTPGYSAAQGYAPSTHGSLHSHGSVHSTHSSHHRPSSYRQSYSSGPPPGADPALWQYFSNVDVDHSGSITAHELQRALINGDWTNFDLDTVKMLMSIFDVDRNGTINYNEFAGLWKYISDWQNVFRHFDRDRSGTIEGLELSEALRSFGYNLSPNLLRLIEQKYASAPVGGYGPSPGITFDRFVRACVVVKSLTESFQRADVNRNGWVQFNYEQFMSVSRQVGHSTDS
ncbi:EF-hand [Dendrothele bispora CBS 962.96]|uniref:EF-hand n=1 Tax=Dendrothele bispora (strain CBS 962.96) TaxID=1314807 RepID=A0A4S8MZB6_DENBC|nr:EF-hand [Dendrothele bispora CBS 962.96]